MQTPQAQARRTILLSGIVGSTAYGLNGPDSDVDRLAVYADPTTRFHGLNPPTHKQGSVVSTKPDITLHEAGKYASLCLGVNPTVTELLWLPENLYDIRTELGDRLIAIRAAFLSAKRVHDSYYGYAFAQFRRLDERGDGTFSSDVRDRTAKHARHMARLVNQGLTLYKTGELTVQVANPAWYMAFGERVAQGDVSYAREFLATAADTLDHSKTPLPDEPDRATVEAWLQDVRIAHFTSDDHMIVRRDDLAAHLRGRPDTACETTASRRLLNAAGIE